jgi:hypothetical protein
MKYIGSINDRKNKGTNNGEHDSVEEMSPLDLYFVLAYLKWWKLMYLNVFIQFISMNVNNEFFALLTFIDVYWINRFKYNSFPHLIKLAQNTGQVVTFYLRYHAPHCSWKWKRWYWGLRPELQVGVKDMQSIRSNVLWLHQAWARRLNGDKKVIRYDKIWIDIDKIW